MRTCPVLIATCALALLTASACGDDAAPAEEELSWEDSPLQEALGSVWGTEQDPEEVEREEQERLRQVEEVVAACMAEEGFEYTPATSTGSYTVYEETEDWDTEEWAQQYGYGVTTNPYADEQPMGPEEEFVDPNEDYLAAMSPAEQEAYYAALHGEPMISEDDDGEWVEEDYEYNWEEAGCYGRAEHESYGEDGQVMWEDPAFTEFFEASDRLYEDAQRDPRVAEINAEWAQCMADAGISGMTTPDEAATSLYEEWDRIYTEASEQVDWESIDWESLDEGADPVADLMEEAGLAELREREIATAVADFACQEDLDTQSRYLAVQFELEEEFVEAHQTEIEALIAAYGQES